MSASLDDVLKELHDLRAAVVASNALIVGTPEACRRLHIGWEQLDALVEAGRIKRVPDLRGAGQSHQYAVAELVRFAETGVTDSNVASIGRAS